ncbi:hypothetical protein CC2G_004180 [Coprinopsis cinerea AmutBmut pab1-1]|nr:hypothetical protein CC2G_004180 [Coprinopsis cinerea AmutBmut pab1-1]
MRSKPRLKGPQDQTSYYALHRALPSLFSSASPTSIPDTSMPPAKKEIKTSVPASKAKTNTGPPPATKAANAPTPAASAGAGAGSNKANPTPGGAVKSSKGKAGKK